MIEQFQVRMDLAIEDLNQKASRREEEFKLQTTALVDSLDSKHAESLIGLTVSHKKQVDELRSFYSISSTNSKKVHRPD